jgi:hypothetical protein
VINLPVRKHPAHCPPIEVGNRSVILFITVCSHRKKQIFATTDAFRSLILAWTQADAWAIGRFVVMPEHSHIFCAPADSRFSVRSWVKFWKSAVLDVCVKFCKKGSGLTVVEVGLLPKGFCGFGWLLREGVQTYP